MGCPCDILCRRRRLVRVLVVMVMKRMTMMLLRV